jgi:hypothetical protein
MTLIYSPGRSWALGPLSVGERPSMGRLNGHFSAAHLHTHVANPKGLLMDHRVTAEHNGGGMEGLGVQLDTNACKIHGNHTLRMPTDPPLPPLYPCFLGSRVV